MPRGDGATTRLALDYWSETRSVIKVGGASAPAGVTAAWITVEGLDVAEARAGYTFTDEAGNLDEFDINAAPIHIEAGHHITIRGCALHDGGNGLFVSADSEEVSILDNEIEGNGNEGSAYEHNSYTRNRACGTCAADPSAPGPQASEGTEDLSFRFGDEEGG